MFEGSLNMFERASFKGYLFLKSAGIIGTGF